MTPSPLGLSAYLAIGIYLVILLSSAWLFRRFNKNVSDYFRNGCQGCWWLAGASLFMTQFSSWTFTGAAGVAYTAGFTIMLIFGGNVVGFLLQGLFLAKRFRQLRAITGPEILQDRFGSATRQVYAWTSVFSIIYSGIHLYGVAFFSSAVFGLPLEWMIVGIGAVVVVYSLFGGSWAVQGTDFLQCFLVMPLSVLLAVLCLDRVGGLGVFWSRIGELGLWNEYRLFNETEFAQHAIDFTVLWAVASFLNQMTTFLSLGSASRYFSVKDGKEASKAAYFAAALMAVGVLVWFVPPMTARLFFAEELAGHMADNPSEASYAFMGMSLLPAGLTGLLVVAVFSATMSSMDSGLNGQSAVFVNDIYPAVCRLFGKKPRTAERLLRLAQWWTLGVGAVIVLIARHMANLRDSNLFRLMQETGAILGTPMAVPLVMALFIRRSPPWSGLVSMGFGVAAAWLSKACGADWLPEWCAGIPALATEWKWHTRVLVTIGAGVAGFLLTLPWWRVSPAPFRERVVAMFRKMDTPVDFAAEVGADNDRDQLMLVGGLTGVSGSLIFLLLLVPDGWGLAGRLGILLIGVTVAGLGWAMAWAGHRRPTDSATRTE